MGSPHSNGRTQDVDDGGRPRCSLTPPVRQVATAAPAAPPATGVTPPALAEGSNAAVTVPLAAYEQPFLELLTAPIRAGIPIKQAHDERNAQIRAFLANLSVLDARALQKRLSVVSEGDDALATAFRRLSHERQQGHLTFLADARMRAALAMNRR